MGLETFDSLTLEPSTLILPKHFNLQVFRTFWTAQNLITIPNAAPYLTRRRFLESVSIPVVLEAEFSEGKAGTGLTMNTNATLEAEIFRNGMLIIAAEIPLVPRKSPQSSVASGFTGEQWVGAFSVQFQNPIAVDIGQNLQIGFTGSWGAQTSEAPLATVESAELFFGAKPQQLFPGHHQANGSLTYHEVDRSP